MSILQKLFEIKLPFLHSIRLFIDSGTSYMRIAIKEKGTVFKEPTYLAYNMQTKDYIFFGSEAKHIFGKTPPFIKIVRPMINGIVSDFDAQVAISTYSIQKSISPYVQQLAILKPSISALTVYPLNATEIEQKAVEEVVLKAGCSQVFLVEKPLATAAGCGFDIFSHKPTLIIDMGGGLIEISIISGGGIVGNKSLRTAGEYMDKQIANYIYLKHGLLLGEATCEKLKKETFRFDGEEKVQLVRGKSLENGLPKSVKVTSNELKESLINTFNLIVDATKELIELSPPEIVDGIYESGITLTGQLASIHGVEDFFHTELKIPVTRAQNFADATINGLITLEKSNHLLKKVLSLKR